MTKPQETDVPDPCSHGFEKLTTLAQRLQWPIAGLELPDYEMLRRALILYTQICRREIPTLERNDWHLIADALWNTLFDPESDVNVVTGLTATIEDAIALDHLDTKWNVDAPTLLAKLQTCSYANFVAILDIVERVKANCDDLDHLNHVIDEAVVLGELYARRPELRRAGQYPETVFLSDRSAP